jgi:nicotinamidase-related amidase
MATVREGNKAALMVIDVQNDVVARAWQRDEVVRRIAFLADRARTEGVPVIYVQHHGEDMQQGSDGWQIVDGIAPRDGEAVIAKKYPDAFEGTDLEGTLTKLGISHLVITGAQTDACVRSTTHRALAEGYDMTLVEDCHTTDDRGFDGVDISAEHLVAHTHLCMQFVSYPGRVSGIAPHDEVSFTTPAGAQEN